MAIYATAVDLSYAGPTMDYGAVRRAGYSFALRYLGNDARCLTTGERDRIYGAGLRLGVIGQRGAVDRPRGGYAAGRADGAFFEDWANRMGWPARKPILCAIADVGGGFPTTSDLPAIDRFLQGLWETISRPVGVYGPYWVLEHFRDDHRVFCYWQSAGGSGSGSGTGGRVHNGGDNSWRRLSDRACMYQEYGSVAIPGTDHNQVFDPNFEAFTHHPDDAEGPTPEEEDYTMKAVKLPEEGDGIWQVVDGLRRVPYMDPPDVEMSNTIEATDGVVELRGVHAERFKARYFATDLGTVHWGPVKLMVDGAARAAEALAEQLPGPVDVPALAVDLAARLAPQLEVAGETITVDRLIERISDELARRLAE